MSFAIVSCSEKDDFFDEPFTPQTYDVQGKVEKGPFISGSEISIQPMDSKLQVLGSLFNTAITDDLGNFMLGSKEFSTPYAEFMANGYFFNEVKGELSNSTLTLRALVDLQDNTTVNVNILTHLKYSRIKNLVSSGKNYTEANKQAQKELLTAFGLANLTDKDVSSFSIISGTDESAALIAISSLLLMERTEAALTEYLSKLSSDFGKNGTFSEDIQSQISKDKNKLAMFLSDIKDNVISRYDNLGINVSVKELSHFIDWNNDGVAGNELLKENQTVTLEKTSLQIPNEGGEYSININSPIAVYLEPQVETELNISPEDNVVSESFVTHLYDGYDESDFQEKEITSECKLNGNTLEISVSKLEGRSGKVKTISLYDYIGNVVAIVELSQEGKDINISVSEAPLLGQDGKNVVASIAVSLVQGLRQYNVIEQYYAYNKFIDKVNDYVYPSSSQITNSWSNIYSTNNKLLQLKKVDESLLNVYGDYCNVLSALYYSNLVYGWDAVPFITDYSQIEQIINQGIHRETTANIWNDLKSKLSHAIDNLAEKKNESLKDINGFFFASKDVARVLLANIHMYQGNYTTAKDLLQKVVDNGFYTLDASKNFMTSTSTDDIDVTESTEVIFALQYDAGTRASVTIMEPGVMPYITLSDVYLSLAECHYELGDSNTAEQNIKKILDAKNISTTETDVLMKIKDVREQILLYSGTYFAFLKRTGLAKTICNIEDYQLLFPIPSNELYSNSQMTQNPGY
ncbi:MAG: hypothetical protein IJE06_06295 [Alistipes sp.]|nr:hypothetical protein [Alistipes sp.]